MKLVTVQTFDNAVGAHAARDLLAQTGIKSIVLDEVVGEALWHIGALSGIKLQVDVADLERARLVLFDRPPEGAHEPWRCAQCQEVIEPDFDVCWSCGSDRESSADPTFHPEAAISEEVDDNTEKGHTDTDSVVHLDRVAADGNPYASSLAPPSLSEDLHIEAASEEVEALVLRAWRAAVIGLCVCPGAFHVLSFVWLIQVASRGQKLSPAAERRYLGAMILDLLVLGLGGMIAFQALAG